MRYDDTRGFTLIELLIGMVLTGLLGTLILQFVLGQAKFGERQTAREDVQQNARGALEIIASELRAVPPGSIKVADADRIRFRLPRAWGVLCQEVAAGTDPVIAAFPPNTIPLAEFPAKGDAGWGFDLPGELSGVAGAERVGIVHANDYSPPTGQTVEEVCAGALATKATLDARGAIAGATPLEAVSGVTAAGKVGSHVFVYQDIEYSAKENSGAGGYHWIYRDAAAGGDKQPLAGPVKATGGLKFEYYKTGQAAPLNTPIANPAEVSRIKVIVSAQSRRTIDGHRPEEVDSMIVHLRNGSP